MASKYIDADVLYRWIQTECNPYGRPTLDYETSVIILRHITEMPPADAVSRKSGYWRLTPDAYMDIDDNIRSYVVASCSCCGERHPNNYMLRSRKTFLFTTADGEYPEVDLEQKKQQILQIAQRDIQNGLIKMANYCSNCGAKMIVEDKMDEAN